jgi:long-chain acyl-CoA synthetase
MAANTAESVCALLEWRAARTPDATAYFVPDGAAWAPVSWSQFLAQTRRWTAVLRGADVGPGSKVGILARNSIDWVQAQMACLWLGAVVVGIDVNYRNEQLGELVSSLSLALLIAEDGELLARVPPEALARVPPVILLRRPAQDARQPAPDPRQRCAADLLAAAQGEVREPPSAAQAAIMVFSSGTTGAPRAVVYTHAQVMLAVDAIVASFPEIDEGGVLLCWLPLANLFQRIIDFCAIAKGAASYLLGDPRAVMTVAATVHPQVLIGVPRFYERVQAAIAARVEASRWPVRGLARWALALGDRRARALREGGRAPFAARLLWPLADRLAARPMRAAFGARVRYLVSGSAPMPRWLLEWFDALGLPVLEAYGVSEDIVPVALNRPAARRLGSVGRPLPPNHVELSPEDEVLVRGPGVSAQSAVDADGFLHSGDLASIDSAGFLWLHGRKSDQFKTAGGHWIAPASIEEALRTVSYVDHAAVIGAGLPQLIAVLALDPARLAARLGAPADGSAGGWLSAEQEQRLRVDVRDALASLSYFERPRGLVLTLRPFSVDTGELTANLKLRRQAVEQRYAESIAALQRTLGAARGLEDQPPLALHYDA